MLYNRYCCKPVLCQKNDVYTNQTQKSEFCLEVHWLSFFIVRTKTLERISQRSYLFLKVQRKGAQGALSKPLYRQTDGPHRIALDVIPHQNVCHCADPGHCELSILLLQLACSCFCLPSHVSTWSMLPFTVKINCFVNFIFPCLVLEIGFRASHMPGKWFPLHQIPGPLPTCP